MNRYATLLPPLAGVSLSLWVAVDAADAQRRPYARKVPVPEDVGNDPYLRIEITSVANARVPSRSEVEAPPYPGARIIRSEPARTLSARSGERYTTLPVVVLVTADELDQVVDFYDRRLSHWRKREINSVFHFWLGGADFDPLDISGKTTPSVRVIRAGNIRLVPDAKTEIHVRYKPGGGYVPGSRGPP